MAQGKPNPFSVFGLIAILASQKVKSTSSLHAIQYFEQYLNGIILQWNRIATATYQSTRPPVAGSRAWVRFSHQEELDFHFYLICWDKVNKHFDKLVKSQRQPEIEIAQRPVKALLGQASKARNFFEHLEEKNQQGHGVGMTGDDELEFSYTDTDRKTKRDLPLVKVKLGKREVRTIVKAYENVVEALRNSPVPTRNAIQRDRS